MVENKNEHLEIPGFLTKGQKNLYDKKIAETISEREAARRALREIGRRTKERVAAYSDQIKEQYMLYVEGAGGPTVFHENSGVAQEEAQRLAAQHPGKAVILLEAVGVCIAHPTFCWEFPRAPDKELSPPTEGEDYAEGI